MTTLDKLVICKLLIALAATDSRPNDNELMYVFQLGNKLSLSQAELQQLKNITDAEASTVIRTFDDSTKSQLPFMMYHLINSDGPATPEEIRDFETVMRAIGRPFSYASFHTIVKNPNS